MCAYAAASGHLDVLKWAREQNAPWKEVTCEYAASGGHLEVLQWARANGAPWCKYTYSRASEGGHLEVLKWARENGAPYDKQKEEQFLNFEEDKKEGDELSQQESDNESTFTP